MRLFNLSRSARRVMASRALECLQCGDFFIRYFLFHGRKEVFPISTQQYYNYQNLLIVKLLNVFLINKIFFNKIKNKKIQQNLYARQYSARVTDWTIASCKVINITDPSKRKNLFYSLINKSFAESFSRLQLGKTSSHVENFKSRFRHSTINY